MITDGFFLYEMSQYLSVKDFTRFLTASAAAPRDQQVLEESDATVDMTRQLIGLISNIDQETKKALDSFFEQDRNANVFLHSDKFKDPNENLKPNAFLVEDPDHDTIQEAYNELFESFDGELPSLVEKVYGSLGGTLWADQCKSWVKQFLKKNFDRQLLLFNSIFYNEIHPDSDPELMTYALAETLLSSNGCSLALLNDELRSNSELCIKAFTTTPDWGMFHLIPKSFHRNIGFLTTLFVIFCKHWRDKIEELWGSSNVNDIGYLTSIYSMGCFAWIWDTLEDLHLEQYERIKDEESCDENGMACVELLTSIFTSSLFVYDFLIHPNDDDDDDDDDWEDNDEAENNPLSSIVCMNIIFDVICACESEEDVAKLDKSRSIIVWLLRGDRNNKNTTATTDIESIVRQEPGKYLKILWYAKRFFPEFHNWDYYEYAYLLHPAEFKLFVSNELYSTAQAEDLKIRYPEHASQLMALITATPGCESPPNKRPCLLAPPSGGASIHSDDTPPPSSAQFGM